MIVDAGVHFTGVDLAQDLPENHEVRARKLAEPGDRVILTAGVPFDVPGTTNLLKVETV